MHRLKKQHTFTVSSGRQAIQPLLSRKNVILPFFMQCTWQPCFLDSDLQKHATAICLICQVTEYRYQLCLKKKKKKLLKKTAWSSPPTKNLFLLVKSRNRDNNIYLLHLHDFHANGCLNLLL